MKLTDLFSRKHQYDEDTQAIIESWRRNEIEIEALETMRQSTGWKLLEKKIREELKIRIREVLNEKKDGHIETLLQILAKVDTKNIKEILKEEVEKFIEEG